MNSEKILYLIRDFFVCSLCLLALNGCNKVPAVDPADYYFTLTLSPEVVDCTGGTVTLSIKTNTPVWTLNCSAPWCTPSVWAGEGDAEVTLTIASHAGQSDRNIIITLSCEPAKESITLTQKQKNALLVSADKTEMTIAGGNVRINAASNVELEDPMISEDAAAWITQTTTETRALASHDYLFEVAPSDEESVRSGVITFKAKGDTLTESVTIYQAQNDVLILSESSYYLTDETEIIVELRTNIDYSVDIPRKADWITLNNTKAARTDQLRFTIAANEEMTLRSAAIVISGNGLEQTLTITQTLSSDHPFLNLTNGGIYLGEEAIATYQPYIDQMVIGYMNNASYFRVQNFNTVKAVSIEQLPIDPKEGDLFTIKVQSMGYANAPSGMMTVAVVKVDEQRLWLYDITTNYEFVVYR